MILLKLFIALSVGFTATSCVFSEKPKEQNESKTVFMEKKQDSDSVLLASIKKINKQLYIGGTVASFLSDSLISKYKEYVFIDEKPGLLSYLSLKYSEKIYIEIEVGKYSYMKSFDEKRQWKLELFNKEKISEIRVLHNDKPIEIVK